MTAGERLTLVEQRLDRLELAVSELAYSTNGPRPTRNAPNLMALVSNYLSATTPVDDTFVGSKPLEQAVPVGNEER
jgi:hypothetical protein